MTNPKIMVRGSLHLAMARYYDELTQRQQVSLKASVKKSLLPWVKNIGFCIQSYNIELGLVWVKDTFGSSDVILDLNIISRAFVDLDFNWGGAIQSVEFALLSSDFLVSKSSKPPEVRILVIR